MIPEGRQLFGRLSVLDNLMLGAYSLDSKEEIQKTLENVFHLFPILRERKGQRSDTFSGENSSSCHRPRSDVSSHAFDARRTFSGTGPETGIGDLQNCRGNNANGVTILLVEQNVHEALQISHRAYVLQTGRVVLEGEGKDLLKSDLVRQAYLGM